MNTIIYYLFIYILCIRPLLSYIQVPPIQFYYYAQIDEVFQRSSRKKKILTYINMTWIDIITMMFLYLIYPIKIEIEDI